MVLRSGDLMAAVEVDRIIGNQEVVAKPYGPQMARVPGLAGLTVLADGTITLLLNPINLVLSQETDATRRPQSTRADSCRTCCAAGRYRSRGHRHPSCGADARLDRERGRI